MSDKNLVKIINEEISEFDFLGNQRALKEEEDVILLQNEDFQKQFIIDSLTKQNKVKIIGTADAIIGGDLEFADNIEEADNLTIEYNITVEYSYDVNKSLIKLDLSFSGDNVRIQVRTVGTKGDYYTAPSGNAWFKEIIWSDIDVNLFSSDGESVKFIAFDKSPQNIKNLFIRHYVEPIIEAKTGLSVGEK